jgi:hypothetical protein
MKSVVTKPTLVKLFVQKATIKTIVTTTAAVTLETITKTTVKVNIVFAYRQYLFEF